MHVDSLSDGPPKNQDGGGRRDRGGGIHRGRRLADTLDVCSLREETSRE